MKMFALMTVLLAASPSYSQVSQVSKAETTQVCSFGVLGEDNYVAVVNGPKELEIEMHEASLSIPYSDIVEGFNSSAVLDKTVTMWAEGEETTVTVTALIASYDGASSKNLTLYIDGDLVQSNTVLFCEYR